MNSEIIHLHWVADFLNYFDFFKNNNKPIVWTLHDMNPFTGGEHYNEVYCGIDENGNPVKRIYTKEEIDVFKNVMAMKMKALENVESLHLVVLCNWMANEVKKSKLFRQFPVTIIPNGFDTNIFKPQNKQFSRDLLGIPAGKIVLLFVADFVDKYRKGYEYLLCALKLINRNDIILCSVGQKSNGLVKSNSHFELGVIQNERFLSVIYSAANVFIIPSIIDNLPNTVIESLLCGTPVVGFPVGGLTDIIQEWRKWLFGF
ncbi:MAG: glycosyltransferase [Paludibacteraceae bacterium]